jgi:hypothetical protein
MKVFRLLAILSLGVVTLVPLAGAQARPAQPSTSYDINFAPYCDGLHLRLPSSGLPHTPRTLDGRQTGCHVEGVFGESRPDADGQYGVTNGTEFVTIPLYGALMVVNPDQTWVLYAQQGDKITIVNQGNWSLGPPAPRPGSPSIFDHAAPSRVSPGIAVHTKDITFDGECEGLHLVLPSAGLRRAGTVDGHFTGCASSPVIGAKSYLGNSSRQAYVVQYQDQATWFQMSIFRNHTWTSFSLNNDRISRFSSGTWSAGAPRA